MLDEDNDTDEDGDVDFNMSKKFQLMRNLSNMGGDKSIMY